jgi:alkaline phosphatase D
LRYARRKGEDGASKLVARARQAFHEFMPIRAIPGQAGRIYRKIAYGPMLDVFLIDMRSYRDSTSNNRDDNSDAFILGPTQLAWLKRELAASDATWKVIAADMPIGIVSEDAIALGDGPPQRREHEIANLLSFMRGAGVRNTVWLTADMHYTAAHHYDPNRAVFQDFEPFWEFVSGPLRGHGRPASSTIRSVRRRCFKKAAARSRAKISPRVSDCSSSAVSISTAGRK